MEVIFGIGSSGSKHFSGVVWGRQVLLVYCRGRQQIKLFDPPEKGGEPGKQAPLSLFLG
jgi:hypothetical protein